MKLVSFHVTECDKPFNSCKMICYVSTADLKVSMK